MNGTHWLLIILLVAIVLVWRVDHVMLKTQLREVENRMMLLDVEKRIRELNCSVDSPPVYLEKEAIESFPDVRQSESTGDSEK